MKLHGLTAVVSSILRRNPPKHTLLRTRIRRVILFTFIHGLTPVVFCEGG